jgi:peptidyl-prolyl cis-trans isomerase SurA
MPAYRIVVLATAVALGALWSGCSGASGTVGPASDVVVAEFGGQQLTLSEFETRYARSAGSREAAAADSIEAYEDFLERYVNFRLKVQEARRTGLLEDPEIQRELDDYRQELARPMLLEREVLHDIVRDLYEKQREEIAASHVLLFVDPNAAPADTVAAYQRLSAIRDSVVAGQLAFHEAALRHSEDPSAAQNQGDLGYFSGGRMIQAFEDHAYGTPVGQVSPVFRTQFGYHILHVTDRRPASPEIQASHILLRLPPHAPTADQERVTAQAEQLLARLRAGEDFAALAREYSEDPGSAPQGGDLGFFTRDRMVAPFADAAYALENPGDISDIVRTDFGLHIIRLEDRKAFPTFEERHDALKRLAERLPRTQERRQEIGRAHRAEVGSTVDLALLDRALARFEADGVLAGIREQGFGDLSDETLATIGTEVITLGEFGDQLRAARIQPAPDQRAQVREIVEYLLNERALDLAAAGLEQRDPEFRRIMEEYTDGVLLFRLSEDAVWNAAARDTLGLQAHYEAHRVRYRFPERRRVVAFYARADTVATMVGQMLGQGMSADQIRAHFDADGRAVLRVDTVRVASPSGSLFDRAFDLEVGGYTEPIQHRAERAILYLDGVEDPRPMTFEEARALVVTEHQEELDRRLVERLRREANVRTYPERLQHAFQHARARTSVATAD